MEAYKKLGIGGGRLALSNSADHFYNYDLLPEDWPTCKGIFLKMVQPTEGKEFTRSRILRRELYQSEFDRVHVEKVLTKLIEAHLVKFTKGDMSKDAQVEVAHEALLRNWPTLTQWLDDERVKLHQRYLLVAAPAQRWEEKDRDPSILLRDSELKDAQKYDDLNKLEDEFIKASVKAEESLKEQEKEQQERELRLIQEKLNQAIIAEQAAQKALEQEKIATDEAKKAQRRGIVVLIILSVSFLGFIYFSNQFQKQQAALKSQQDNEQTAIKKALETQKYELINELQKQKQEALKNQEKIFKSQQKIKQDEQLKNQKDQSIKDQRIALNDQKKELEAQKKIEINNQKTILEGQKKDAAKEQRIKLL